MVKRSGTKAEIEALSRDKQSNLHKGRYKEVAEICNYLGELLMREERYQDAISEHETELEMCEKSKDDLGKAIANRKIGECYCAMGDFEKALRFQQKHLTISRQINSDIEQQRAYATIGRTYMCRAEGTDELADSLRKAKEAFNCSLNFAIILKDEMEASEYSLMVGRLFLNLGILSEMNGSMLGAIKYLKDARAMMKDSKLQEEELKCVSLLGSISLNMGDLESAENLAATAYALAKQLKNKPAIAESLLLRASIALESEKFMEARHCLKKILKNKAFCEENKPKTKKMLAVSAKLQFSLQRLKGQVGGDEEIRLLDSLADDYCSVECFYSALRYYKRMLDAAKNSGKSSSELAAIFVSLAQTSADLKNYADAIRYAREEVNLRDDPEQRCRTWLNIADYSHRMEGGDAAGIVEIYEKAIKEAQRSGKTKLLARCLRYQQTVFRGMDDLEKVDDLETRIREIKPTEDGESEEEDEDALSRASSPDTPNCSSLTESDDENEVDDDGNNKSGINRRGLYKIRRNEKGETLLHTAVIGGNLKRVKQLVAAGHPVNERDHCGWLPIHEAANHNFLEIATFLIEHNALLNDRGLKGCNGLTPILDAAYSGNLEMVRLLHNRGATVTCKDNDGKTVIDALMAWRTENFIDTSQSMDAATAKDLEELIGTLQAAMIQAGMRPEQLRSGLGKGGSSCGSAQRSSASKAIKKAKEGFPGSGNGRSASPHLDTDAANMYQAAIDSMRSSNYRQRREKRKRAPSPLAAIVNDDAALIRPEEFIDEDWLIEDVSSSDGLRVSRNAADILFTSGVRQSTGKRKASGSGPKAPPARLKPSGEYGESSSMDIECIEISRPSRSGVDKNNVLEEEGQWPKETTGIFPVSSSPTVSTSSSCIGAYPVASVAASALAPPPSSLGRLRIRIEDLVILVPLAPGQDRTIGWLSEEAALRYSELKGIKPLLQLKTVDGALLSALDLVRDVVAHSEEVVGFAVSWHNPPMAERFAKSSLASGVSESANLRQALLSACETGILTMADLSISSSRAAPVFRSLQFQNNIRQLLLEANPIGDSGFEILLEVFSSLPNLTHVDLGCTELSNVSLEGLGRTLTGQRASCLQCLSDLNLSHNDFSDEGISNLTEIIGELPCLTTLKLEDCGLTRNFLDRREAAFRSALRKPLRLRNLSLAWNQLESKGVGRLFSLLPPGLKMLNVSGCLSEGRQSLLDFGNFLPAPNLESLLLSNWNFSADFFSDFLKILKNFSVLRTVDLSGNTSLGAPEVGLLLEALSSSEVQWISVDLSGMPVVGQMLPTLLRVLETSPFLRELTVTIDDETALASVIQSWKSFKGGSVYRYAGTPTVQLCSL